jgi:hypothetical protein
MSGFSYSRRRPGSAPAIVDDVLRTPGIPLDPSVTRAFTKHGPTDVGHTRTAAASGTPTLDAPGSASESEAERLAGPLAAGTASASPLPFDLSRIRIHTDPLAAASARAVGARAYAVGTRLVFGHNQYQPASLAGRRLLAHELVHSAQAAADPTPTLRRYEAPEHQDFGDAGLENLATFLATTEGRAFGATLGSAKAVADLQRDPFLKGKRFTVQGVTLTVGDIIAMGGDFYASPADLLKADPGELEEIRDAMREEREGKLKGGKANERYQAITQKYIGRGKRSKDHTFLGLARVNAPHFTPTNRTAWKTLHMQALQAAREAGKDASKLDTALLIDTFGAHFLTDAFASGHLFDKQKLEVEIDGWLARNKVAPPNPEMSTYYGIVGKDTRLLVLKNIHDRLNAEGIEVSNGRGMKWKTFGDDHLKQATDSLRIGAFAVYESRRQVMAANRAGAAASTPSDDAAADDVLSLLPDPKSVEQATAKAISYIPWAAQTITDLIYRQRGAGALELKERLGPVGSVVAPIVKANLATIADPGREKQLQRLEEEQRRRNTGPLLAPQFTIATF